MPGLDLTSTDLRFLKALKIKGPGEQVADAIPAQDRFADRRAQLIADLEAGGPARRLRTSGRRIAQEVAYDALAGTLREKDAALLAARRWRRAFWFLAGVAVAALAVWIWL